MNASLVYLVAMLPCAQPAESWRPVHPNSPDWPAPHIAQVPEYDVEYDGDVYESDLSDPQAIPEGEAPFVAPNGDFAVPYQSEGIYGDQFDSQYQTAPGYHSSPGYPYGSGYPSGGYGSADCRQTDCYPSNQCLSYGRDTCAVQYGGPRAYREGWTYEVRHGSLPKERVSGADGHFRVTEFDTDITYRTRSPYKYIYTLQQQFGLRLWEGPETPPGSTTELPGSVFRFGWDFVLATPTRNPWSIELAFTPSINSDFEDNLTRDAWNFDSRGILYYRTSPYWTYAIGAGFWDRVDDQVIPYAGFIYTPDRNTRWEIMFPESRYMRRLGNIAGGDFWFYIRGEYHVEAYEVRLPRSGGKDKVEIEDWRAVIGIWEDRKRFSKFVEAGFVFGRDVEFLHGTPGFDPSSGFIARGGFRF